MPVYFEYALKVSLSMAVIFIFYTLLLKRMTWYTWNRYFLLMFSVLSFIVPFINVDLFIQDQEEAAVSLINEIPSIHSYEVLAKVGNNTAIINYSNLFPLAFLLVSLILVLRLLIQILSIRKIKAKSTLLAAGSENIYHIPESILPFSFLNNIFINTNNYSENELQKILDHERVHVQQKHTIDVLLAEIICIANWYNPFAWLIKKAVRENLEFIADSTVLNKGFDKKSYQYLLLKVNGNTPSSITSSLKFSSLKNRIVMMNKTKTSKYQLMKFALLVPIVIVLLVAFRSRQEVTSTTSDLKMQSAESYTLSQLTYAIPDQKIKLIVLKAQEKSLLKPGEISNLTLIHNEKDRLKNLLESNGYRNLKSNAIRFMIDTATINNSFSIEVNINVEAALVLAKRKNIQSNKREKITSSNNDAADLKIKAAIDNRFQQQLIYPYLNPGTTKSGC